MSDPLIPIEKLYDKIGSIYKLVILAARRAVELNEGAAQLIETQTDRAPLIALQEIMASKISYKIKGS
ncbi:DNA-directed RNA polymerase subunit omega [Candidatus Omnitrophota bacterium]